MPSLGIGDAVFASSVVLVGAILLIFGLYGLSRRRTRFGPISVRVGDEVLGRLALALVFPSVLVSGFGNSILHANIWYWPTPDDFRNSTTFVNICWFFILPVAPSVSLLGFWLLGFGAFRRWQEHRRRKNRAPKLRSPGKNAGRAP